MQGARNIFNITPIVCVECLGHLHTWIVRIQWPPPAPSPALSVYVPESAAITVPVDGGERSMVRAWISLTDILPWSRRAINSS